MPSGISSKHNIWTYICDPKVYFIHTHTHTTVSHINIYIYMCETIFRKEEPRRRREQRDVSLEYTGAESYSFRVIWSGENSFSSLRALTPTLPRAFISMALFRAVSFFHSFLIFSSPHLFVPVRETADSSLTRSLCRDQTEEQYESSPDYAIRKLWEKYWYCYIYA